MYIINRRKNIRLIGDEHHIGDDFEFVIYKVQIKVLWFWVTIKEFDEDEYYDAVDCFRYCTNPYMLVVKLIEVSVVNIILLGKVGL